MLQGLLTDTAGILGVATNYSSSDGKGLKDHMVVACHAFKVFEFRI